MCLTEAEVLASIELAEEMMLDKVLYHAITAAIQWQFWKYQKALYDYADGGEMAAKIVDEAQARLVRAKLAAYKKYLEMDKC